MTATHLAHPRARPHWLPRWPKGSVLPGPLTVPVVCDEEVHRITLRKGRVTLLDHTREEIRAAQAARALGAAEMPACLAALWAFQHVRHFLNSSLGEQDQLRVFWPDELRDMLSKARQTTVVRANAHANEAHARRTRHRSVRIESAQHDILDRLLWKHHGLRLAGFTSRAPSGSIALAGPCDRVLYVSVEVSPTWWQTVYLKGLAVIDGAVILQIDEVCEDRVVHAVRQRVEPGFRAVFLQKARVALGRLEWLSESANRI